MSDTHWRPRTHWRRYWREYNGVPNRYACAKRQMEADVLTEAQQAEAEMAHAEADAEYARIMQAEESLFYSSERGLYRHAE